MFDAAHYTTENNAVDWRELADQVFPADALRTTRQRTILWQWAEPTSDASA